MRKPPSDRPPGPDPKTGASTTGLLPRSRGSGFAAEGPGFYVWDDFARETRERASELRAVVRPTSG